MLSPLGPPTRLFAKWGVEMGRRERERERMREGERERKRERERERKRERLCAKWGVEM